MNRHIRLAHRPSDDKINTACIAFTQTGRQAIVRQRVTSGGSSATAAPSHRRMLRQGERRANRLGSACERKLRALAALLADYQNTHNEWAGTRAGCHSYSTTHRSQYQVLRSRESGGPCRAVAGSDAGKLGAEETRAGEVCAAEIGACEIGVPKIGIAEVSPQGRVRQVGLSQRGAWGVGPLKVGSDEL